MRAWYNLCVTHQQELARILTAEQGESFFCDSVRLKHTIIMKARIHLVGKVFLCESLPIGMMGLSWFVSSSLISQESHWQKQAEKLVMALHSSSGSGAPIVGTSFTNETIPNTLLSSSVRRHEG